MAIQEWTRGLKESKLVWHKIDQTGGRSMTLYEGIILANLVVLVWATYQIGKIKVDIETLYEGLALALKDNN